MSRNYFTAKKPTRKQKINYLFGRQLFFGTNFLNSTVYEVFSSIVFFLHRYTQSLYSCFLNKFSTLMHKLQLLKFSLHCTLESFLSECSSLKETRIYECPSHLLGELGLVLKLSRILYIYQLSNIAVNCSRNLFHCITWKSDDVYTIKFVIVYIVVSVFFCLLHKEFPYAVLMQRLQKRHKRCFFKEDFFVCFSGFAGYLLKYKKLFRVSDSGFPFPKI